MSDYYKHQHLVDFGKVGEAAPEVARKFFDFYAEAFKDGALSEREKSLIALAVAHTVQCPYCIEAYTEESLRTGADLPQMTEAVFVATAIRGGATLVHGMQMKDVARAKGMT
jgi:alkylhydroperoxidase/carboxymuconolactone decarboxylase family protein